MYTHILIHCDTEDDATTVFALCSGEPRCIVVDGRAYAVQLPTVILETIAARRVAPRTIRLDKHRVSTRDIDFAYLRQIFVSSWALVSDMHMFDERDGFAS